MSTSQCRRCRQTAVTYAPSGKCETCLAEADATTPADGTPLREPFEPLPGESLTPPDFHEVSNGVLPDWGYDRVERLGEGGMGVVDKAVQRTTGQTVAVKRLHRDHLSRSAVRRFVTEARALAAVQHPNVVRLYDFVPDPDDPTLVMEYVPGTSLAKRVKQGGALATDRAAELVAAAARGVQAAHDAGVIHRDLKPANLLLTPDGVVKVADFGLSKELDAADGVTRTGQVVGGTPGFLAPEQVDDRFGEPGVRTDVWGLGATLYALLTGRPPFPSTKADTHRVVCDPVVAPRRRSRGIPPVLEAIVLKCLEKDPSRRYESAAAVADDLDRYRRGESTSARPLSWATALLRRVRTVPVKVMLPWAMLAAVVLAVAVVVFLPKLVAEEPQDRHKRLFEAGEEVVIVPKAGPPEWCEWQLGQSDVTELPAGAGAAFITPKNNGVLKLFDPPTGNYRVTADLRHWEAADQASAICRVGLVLFHERFTDANGSVDRFLEVSFADFDRAAVLRNPAIGTQTIDAVWWYFRTDPTGTETRPDRYALRQGIYPLATTNWYLPGKWRRLAAEVSPEGLKLLWGADADAPDCDPMPIVAFTAAELNAHCAQHREMAAEKWQLPAHMKPNWNPAGGLGVSAHRSGLAFRSVSVRALTP